MGHNGILLKAGMRSGKLKIGNSFFNFFFPLVSDLLFIMRTRYFASISTFSFKNFQGQNSRHEMKQ